MKPRVTKDDFFAAYAKRSNRTVEFVRSFLETLHETIIQALVEDHNIELPNLGLFELEWDDIEDTGYHLFFTPCSAWKEKVNAPFSHLEKVELSSGDNIQAVTTLENIDHLLNLSNLDSSQHTISSSDYLQAIISDLKEGNSSHSGLSYLSSQSEDILSVEPSKRTVGEDVIASQSEAPLATPIKKTEEIQPLEDSVPPMNVDPKVTINIPDKAMTGEPAPIEPVSELIPESASEPTPERVLRQSSEPREEDTEEDAEEDAEKNIGTDHEIDQNFPYLDGATQITPNEDPVFVRRRLKGWQLLLLIFLLLILIFSGLWFSGFRGALFQQGTLVALDTIVVDTVLPEVTPSQIDLITEEDTVHTLPEDSALPTLESSPLEARSDESLVDDKETIQQETPDSLKLYQERHYTAFLDKVTIKASVRLVYLSQKYYGHKVYWVYIYEANRDILAHPDALDVGMVIAIPKLPAYLIDYSDQRTIDYANALKKKYLEESSTPE